MTSLLDQVDDIEAEILDLLCDEDDDLHVGEALTVLLHVAAGLCCCATTHTPDELATEFAVKLRQLVARGTQSERLLQ